MSITISLSTLVWLAAWAVLALAVAKLYDLLIAAPKRFQQYWTSQGVTGEPYRFPLGVLPDIQRAADSDRIVEYAFGMARKYGLLQWQIVAGICHIISYDPEVCRAIFTNKAQYYHKASQDQKEIMRPLLHNGLLLSEDAYWKRQRALISPGFHFWYLQEMVPIICKCVSDWVQMVQGKIDASPDGSVELEMNHELATITLDSVATAAFGNGFRADPERADRFIHALKQVLDNMQARTLNLLGFIPVIKNLPLPSLRAIQSGCATIEQIVKDIVADRKAGRSGVVKGGKHAGMELMAQRAAETGEALDEEATRRRDLLDLLLEAQANMPEGEVLTDRAVEEESINFIAAGAETTSNLCVWMLWRTITQPPVSEGQSILEKVRRELVATIPKESVTNPSIDELKELKYLEALTYESLRLHPPAPTIPKYAIEDHDITWRGKTVHIPKGTTVLINANVIHRLEEYWPQPEEFRPERFLSGGGNEQNNNVNDSVAPSPAGSDPTTPQPCASPVSPKTAEEIAAERARKAAQPFAYLGFSAGPRKCVGKNFAMLEIKIIFSMILRQLNFELVPNQYIAANPITRLPRQGIKFRVTKRNWMKDDDQLLPSHDGLMDDAVMMDNVGEGMRQRQQHASVSVLKPLGMI